LKILYVTAADLAGGEGASEHVLGITTQMGRMGHEVDLLARNTSEQISAPGVRFQTGDRQGSLLRQLRHLGSAAVRIARETRPDIIYLRTFPLDYFLAVRSLGQLDIPIACEVNTLLASEYLSKGKPIRGWVFSSSERLTLAASAGWLGVTQEILDQVSSRSRSRRPTALALNGFDPADVVPRLGRSEIRKTLGVPEEKDVLLMAGFSKPWHGSDRAIQMMTRLPDAELWLVGGSSLARDYASKLARDLRVDGRVRLWPWVSKEEVVELVSAADVGIGPLALDRKGMREAQPIKGRLYMALGLPILMNYADPAFPSADFVGTVNSLDPGILARRCLSLLKLSGDAGMRAKKFASEKLTWAHAAEATCTFLEMIAGARRAGCG
jgi:glycosyltransferase involved in cell wall biosynthesis